MAFTKSTADLNIIQALDDEPNDVGGLSSAQLKEKLDTSGNTLQTFMNSHIDELEAKAAAASIGAVAADGTTASNVQAELTNLHTDQHTHDNKTVLDGIAADNVANWDSAHSKEHTHDNKTALDTVPAGGVVTALGGDDTTIPTSKAVANAMVQAGNLPSGGVVGQVLCKASDGNYDIKWDTIDLSGLQNKITASGILKGTGDGSVEAAVAGIDYFCPIIKVTVDTGSTVTATNGSMTVTGVESSTGVYTLHIPDYGTWTVTATLSGQTTSATITVDTVKICSVTLAYLHIYGVLWDGTSTTALSRTDDAAGFTNPVPYISGATNYSSPFDNLQPWAGMVRTTDAAAGELVAIPKYWFKWTKSGNSMKLQIADKATEGFSVSPAHADRGDGSGERDTVYVGRYHCNSAYKSVTGAAPKASITRADARAGIHGLGAKIWQYDFAMYWTIMMLYLVEFADWNSQAKIGYGCGNQSAAQNVGASDSMPYHTGTMRSSRTTYGVGCQYRYIEGLWDNVYDWCDGIYFSGANVYCIKNPANFSDTANGTNIGTRPTSSNYISAWSIPTASGFEYALYPSDVAGSESTYICDCYYYDSSGVALHCGGGYSQDQHYGLFCLYGYHPASGSSAYIGCRLQKLP